jgi:hypothetical protein
MYTGKMFRVGGIYKSAETENQPAVLDELGRLRVIGEGCRFVVGHLRNRRWFSQERPIFAHFIPVADSRHANR